MARTSTGRRAQGPERTPPKRVPARAPRTEPDLLPSQEGQADESTPAASPKTSARTPIPFTWRGDATPDADAEAVMARDGKAPAEATPTPAPVGETPFTPEPADPETQSGARLALESLTVQDVDRLWDWYRADANARALFEQRFASSPELHQALSTLVAQEASGRAWVRAVRYMSGEGSVHLGLVLLGPFLPGPTAAFRLYLEPRAQPVLEAFLPAVLNEIDLALPGVTLSLLADAHTSELMQRHGFEAQIILTRTPARPDSSEA